MNGLREEELNLIDMQLVITTLFFVAVGTSLALTYNRRLTITGQKPFWTNVEANNISKLARYATLIAASGALYVSIKNTELLEKKNASKNDIDASKYEQIVAILAVIAILVSCHAIHVADSRDGITDLENPEV